MRARLKAWLTIHSLTGRASSRITKLLICWLGLRAA